jgi:hypothetical protein
MGKKRYERLRGFTITELAITTVVSLIVIAGIAVILVDGQRGWNQMYSRTYADVVVDSHIARRMFDSVIRRASREKLLIDQDGNWVEIYYYSDPTLSEADLYARFYTSGGQLNLEHGKLVPTRQTLRVETVCDNAQSCVFKSTGRSIQMILALNDGTQSNTVVCSAVMHNE